MKNYNLPVYALSGIVLVEALLWLCRSQAIFSPTLDGSSSFHVEWLIPLSRSGGMWQKMISVSGLIYLASLLSNLLSGS